ncbi:hypothetical protein KY321_01590 [Candidatus Woesearchaeota archaeon]|nr:hypothetical protein [Candidatus Woesearchaeota archaeon]
MKKGVLLLVLVLVTLIAANIVLSVDLNTYNFDYDTQRVSIQGLSKFNKISIDNPSGGLLVDFRSSTPLESGIFLSNNILLMSYDDHSKIGFLNTPFAFGEKKTVSIVVGNDTEDVFKFEKYTEDYAESYNVSLGNEFSPVDVEVMGDLYVFGDESSSFISSEQNKLRINSDSEIATLELKSQTRSDTESKTVTKIDYSAEDDTLYFESDLVVRDPEIRSGKMVRDINMGALLRDLTKLSFARTGSYYLANGKHSIEQCEILGGEAINVNDGFVINSPQSDGNDFCLFDGDVCPSGWKSFLNWGIKEEVTCSFEEVVSEINSQVNTTVICPQCDFSCTASGSDGLVNGDDYFCNSAIPYDENGVTLVEKVTPFSS